MSSTPTARIGNKYPKGGSPKKIVSDIYYHDKDANGVGVFVFKTSEISAHRKLSAIKDAIEKILNNE